mgnify:CR=1 FL=1
MRRNDEREIQMESRDLKDVQSIIDIVCDIEKMGRQLNGMMERLPLDSLKQTLETLEDIAVRADENQDIELLKSIFYQIMPEFDKIDEVCRNIGSMIYNANLEKVGSNLEDQRLLLESLFPHNMVHIAADTIANAGDYILVRSLKKLVEHATGQQIHWSNVDVRAAVTDSLITGCNRSEGVILGGGGFFLKDTNPNDISGWQWPCSLEDMDRIKAPVYVLGVGYNRFRGQEEFAPCFTESINKLVEKSAFFGLRNYGSIRAVRNYLRDDMKDKVVYHPCATTVLSKLYELPERTETEQPFIALNCAFDRAEMRYGNRMDEVMTQIAHVCKKLSENYRIKCYIHCPPDELVCPYLEREGVVYEPVYLNKEMKEEEYLRYFTEPELVLAIRGHAQMIPFGCKTPTVSMISHDKLAWFLEDIGHPEWGVEVLDEDFENKLLDISEYMLANRTQICTEIEEAQECLWNIMMENLKSITVGRNELC